MIRARDLLLSLNLALNPPDGSPGQADACYDAFHSRRLIDNTASETFGEQFDL